MPSTDEGRSELARGLAEGRDLRHDASILIVDDYALSREYLAAILAANGRVPPSVAWDLPSLITALEDAMPSVILLDMATRDSAVLLRATFQVRPNARVIVLGVSGDDDAQIVACAEAGVCGYHLRTESLDDLLVLIGKVASGESLVSPGVSAMLLRRLSALAARRQPAAKELVLTPREAQILRMLEMGLSNRNIADHLGIAIHTVKNHVHSLLTKLGVSSRVEAAALARTVRYTEGLAQELDRRAYRKFAPMVHVRAPFPVPDSEVVYFGFAWDPGRRSLANGSSLAGSTATVVSIRSLTKPGFATSELLHFSEARCGRSPNGRSPLQFLRCNGDRRHEAIGYVTPDDEHTGRGEAIRQARRDGLDRARQRRLDYHRRTSTNPTGETP